MIPYDQAVTAETPLYNSRTISNYLGLLKSRYPQADRRQLLDYARMTPYQVADPAHWFTQEQADRFQEKIIEMTGNADIAYEAGRFSVSEEAIRGVRQHLLSFVGPARGYDLVGKTARHFTRSSAFSCRRLAPNQVEITVAFHPDVAEKPYQCRNRLGSLESLVEIMNHRLLEVEHPECIFTGGSVCRYLISWEFSLSARLKKFRNLLVPLLAVGFAASLALLPAGFWPWSLAAALAGALGISLAAAVQENKEIGRNLEELRAPGSHALEQVHVNYSHALVVREIGETLAGGGRVEDLLEAALGVLSRRLDFSEGVIWLADGAKRELVYRHDFGLAPEQRAQMATVPLDLTRGAGCALVRAFLEKRPLLVEEAQAGEGDEEDFRQLAARFGWTSFLCCPILSDQDAVGLMALAMPRPLRPLMQSDLSLAQGLAPMIGVSISNAALLEAQLRHSDEIRTLEQARDAIAAAKERSDRLAQELKESNEEIKNFSFIVSHDLRAPLTNIQGFADELAECIGELTPILEKNAAMLEGGDAQLVENILRQDLPEALDFINSSVQRMDGQINALLKLSRLGRRELNPEPVATGELVGNLLKTLTHRLEQRRARVKLGALPDLVADRVCLEQIFGNLLDNATKYLDPDRDGEIEVDGERRGTETVFWVRDNGRGIAAEEMGKVFAIFQRAGRQDTPGEGMGLAYVRTLVRRLAGRIWCESELGAGTTFFVSLPDASPPAIAEAV